jgi:hypothetical protein
MGDTHIADRVTGEQVKGQVMGTVIDALLLEIQWTYIYEKVPRFRPLVLLIGAVWELKLYDCYKRWLNTGAPRF